MSRQPQPYDENNIKEGNALAKVLINGIPATITSNNLCSVIVLKDNNEHPLITYTMNSFYNNFLGEELTQYSKETVQYYNITEEEIFQYNTVQDYNTHQAMVHLHDRIRVGKKCTTPDLIERIQECIEHATTRPHWQYTITLL